MAYCGREIIPRAMIRNYPPCTALAKQNTHHENDGAGQVRDRAQLILEISGHRAVAICHNLPRLCGAIVTLTV